MQHRKLIVGALTALIGLAVVPIGVEAAWNGITTFPCYGSGASWTFDGLMGPFTERAVRQFQRARGLTPDGIAGPATMRALKLPYGRTLRCGMGGRDALLLQHRLASLGFWGSNVTEAHTRPATRPTTRPTARPTPYATETPDDVESTPPYSPEPTETPYATPTPRWTPKATPTPGSEVESLVPTNEPTFELEVGTWAIPIAGYWYVPGVGGSAANVDWSVVRTNWLVDGTAWAGNVGVGASLAAFNLTNASFNLGPFSQSGAMMYEGVAKYRFDHGYYQVFGGYRGLNQGTGLNFGTVGVGMERPLVSDWLWLEGKLQGGHNFSNSYFYDGQLGLGLRVGVAGIDLGFRHLGLQPGVDPLATVNGPVATVKLRF